jgi:hypothetical protein
MRPSVNQTSCSARAIKINVNLTAVQGESALSSRICSKEDEFPGFWRDRPDWAPRRQRSGREEPVRWDGMKKSAEIAVSAACLRQDYLRV